MYYGQTARSLNNRIVEHKTAVASFDQNSKVASHVHHFCHNMSFENVKVIGFEANYQERHSLVLYFGSLGKTISYFTSRKGGDSQPLNPTPKYAPRRPVTNNRGDVAALLRSHMIGLLPFGSTIEQTTETMPLSLTQLQLLQ